MRAETGLWRRLDAASRRCFPAGMLVFGLFVIGLPLSLPGLAEVRPVYAIACVFFWTLYRPSALPAVVVALTGLLLDLVGLSPIGLWAVLLLVLQGSVLALRRRLVPQNFVLTWAMFTGLAALFVLAAWAVESALTLNVLPVAPVVAEIILAGAIYPALAGVFIRAHRGPAAVELA
jgi:rod shape-determining protein MreD